MNRQAVQTATQPAMILGTTLYMSPSKCADGRYAPPISGAWRRLYYGRGQDRSGSYPDE